MSKLINYKPYPYQREGILKALRKKYSLNGFEMGLGKTLVAIATSLVRGHTTLVVCPAFLIDTWLKEIHKICKQKQKVTLVTNKTIVNGSSFYIVSYDSFNKAKNVFPEITFLVCDEVQYLKNEMSQRSKRIHKYLKEYRPDMFLGLSGTSIKNNIPEFYSLLKLVNYGGKYPEFDKYSSMYLFCRDFANKVPNKYNLRGWEWAGNKNVSELKSLLRPIYIRKKASEELDLPKQIWKNIKVAKTSKNDKELVQAWNLYRSDLKNSESFSSAKAVNALSKVKATVELARSILESGQKVVVFSDHVQAAEEIAKALGGGLITGGVSNKKRREIELDFRKDLRCVVATIQSASVGIDLTSSSYMVVNDFPWVPADIDQAEKRIHRIGQKNTCFYYYIFSSNIDYRIYSAVKEKRKIIEEVLDC